MQPEPGNDLESPRMDVIKDMCVHASQLVAHGGARSDEVEARFIEAGLSQEELRFAMAVFDGQSGSIASARNRFWLQQVGVWLGAFAMVGLLLLVMWFVEFR